MDCFARIYYSHINLKSTNFSTKFRFFKMKIRYNRKLFLQKDIYENRSHSRTKSKYARTPRPATLWRYEIRAIHSNMEALAKQNNFEIEFFQSNFEGEMVSIE